MSPLRGHFRINSEHTQRMKTPKYKRIMLKLSGEALMGEKQFGIDADILKQYSLEIKSIHDHFFYNNLHGKQCIL